MKKLFQYSVCGQKDSKISNSYGILITDTKQSAIGIAVEVFLKNTPDFAIITVSVTETSSEMILDISKLAQEQPKS